MDGRFDHGFAQMFTLGEDHSADASFEAPFRLAFVGVIGAVVLGLCIWQSL